MKRLSDIFNIIVIISALCGCSMQDSQLCYQEGRCHYLNGEVTIAVPYYIQCITSGRKKDNVIVAHAYRDLAASNEDIMFNVKLLNYEENV